MSAFEAMGRVTDPSRQARSEKNQADGYAGIEPDGTLSPEAIVALSRVLADTVNAKGDLLVGSAADALTRFQVGADGKVFVADSSTPLGVSWKEAPVIDASKPPYNGVFDGSSDDTAAVNAATLAAIAAKKGLLIPGRMKLSDTWLAKHPTDGTRFALDIFAPAGEYNQITWAGGNNKAMFRSVGMMRCNAHGMRFRIPDGTTGLIGADCDVQHTTPAMNSSIVTWIGLTVLGDRPANAIGLRLAHSSQGEDMSVHQFIGMTVTMSGSQTGANGTGTTANASDVITSTTQSWVVGDRIIGTNIPANATVLAADNTAHTVQISAPATGSGSVSLAFRSTVTGVQVLGGNTLGLSWYGGGVSGCNIGFSTVSTDSAQDGSYSLFFDNVNNSNNQTEYQFARPGGYKIDGGRYEVGGRFLDCASTSNLTTSTRAPVKVTVRNAQIVNFRPSDGILFNVNGAGNVAIEDNLIQTIGASDVAFGADMVHVATHASSFGMLSIQRNMITASVGSTTGGAPQKLYTLGGGTWTVKQDDNSKIDVAGASAGAVTGMLDRILPSRVKTIAMGNLGSTATLDCTGAPEILVTGTLTANCTLTLSNMQPGQSVTFELTQDATGSRTITFSPTPKMPGGGITLSTAAAALDVVTLWSTTGGDLRAALAGKAFA